jgi:glycosyltransferase involved in cell wall biosynthesis
MKVLVLSNLYPPDVTGGYELGCHQVVEALRRRGHHVEVLTSSPRTPVSAAPGVQRVFQLSDVYNSYIMERSTALTRKLYEAQAKLVNAHNCHQLLSWAEGWRPDVAYLWNLIGVGGLGLVACLHHRGVPWVWHLMDSVPTDLCACGWGPIPPLVREFSRQARGSYLACSTRVLDEIEDHGLSLRSASEVVPNWITGAQSSSCRQYLPQGKLRIVAAGQLAPHKGTDRLIAAAGLLRDRGHTNFAVDLYGKLNSPAMPDLVRRHGVEDFVTFRGPLPQSELVGRYEDYDLFAFPTWEREPFAFAPLEAAARGCVPLMTADCGNSEWFVHGVHCLKAERTPEAFANVFADVLAGRIDLEVLGWRVRSVVWRDYHLDAVLPRIEAALTRAARQPRRAVGAAAQAYRLALLAEKLTAVFLQEAA